MKNAVHFLHSLQVVSLLVDFPVLDYCLDLIFPNLNDSVFLRISVMSISVLFSPGFPNSGNRESLIFVEKS